MNDNQTQANNFGINLDNGGNTPNSEHINPIPTTEPTGTVLTTDAIKEKIKQETYSHEEQNDVNAITVTIPDTITPIVVLFGPKSSGKTLVLLRMIRWLEQNEFQVVPEMVFRPQHDEHYSRMCAELKNIAYSTYTPGGTDQISFMLNKVLDNVGNPRFQLLEAPGEHYFDVKAPNDPFPTYINHIRTTPNRKVWVFIVEQNWGRDQGERNMYAQKICQMQQLMSPKDKVVFLINQVDKLRGQFKPDGHPNIQVFFNNIKQQYPGIFSKYKNSGLSSFLYGEYNFKAVCFSSGVFNKTNTGKEVWTLENDWYCQELWKALKA